MVKTDILSRLRDMHQELSSINDDQKLPDKVDDDTIDALGQLVTDVGRILDRVKGEQPGSIPDDDSLSLEPQDLRDRILQMESDHPRVAQFLSQVTDLLAMMGI